MPSCGVRLGISRFGEPSRHQTGARVGAATGHALFLGARGVSTTNFDRYLKQQLTDPTFARRFKKAGQAWDVALQIAALRQRAAPAAPWRSVWRPWGNPRTARDGDGGGGG